MKVCLFGEYQKEYSRNLIILNGLYKNKVDITEFHLPYSKYKIKNYWKSIKNFKKFKEFDAVIFGTPCVSSFFPFGKLLKAMSDTKVIFDPFVSIYETEIEDRQKHKKSSVHARIYWMIDKLSMTFPHISLSDTQEHIEYYTKTFRISESKFRVLPIGAYDELFFPKENKDKLETDNINVLFYGNYIPLQGADVIVNAARYLDDKYKIKMIGSGQTFEEVNEIVKKHKLTNVTFHPPVKYSELPDEISKADICLGIFGDTPKAKRVIPNKVYEPSAMKKPIITADTPAVSRIFEHNKDLLTVPPGNPKMLADAIIQLGEDLQTRKKLGLNIYNIFIRNFTSQRIGEKLIKIINNR